MVCVYFSRFISSQPNNIRSLPVEVNVARLATLFPFHSCTFECIFGCHKQQLCSQRALHEKSFDSEDGLKTITSNTNKVNIDTIFCYHRLLDLALSFAFPAMLHRSRPHFIHTNAPISNELFDAQQQSNIPYNTLNAYFHNSNEQIQQSIRCRHSNYVIITCLRANSVKQ